MPYPCTDSGCPVGPAEHGHLDPLPPIPGNHPDARSVAAGVIHRQTDALADCRDALRASCAEVAALRRALEHVRDHLYGVACHEYHAGLNDGRNPTLCLLDIIEPALARGE